MAKKNSSNTQIVDAANSQTRAAWIAAIAAVVAILISCFSLYESHETRVAVFHDELVIRARRPMGDTPIFIHKESGPAPFDGIRAPWNILISNTGASTVSITGYDVLQIGGTFGEMFYSGLKGGLHSPESEKSVSLPISLEAGQSIRLLLVVGMNPGVKAYKLLLAEVGDHDAQMPVDTAEKLLAKNGVDMYDNPVSLLGSGDESNGWRVDKQGKEQIFLVKFHTARGAEAKVVMSWYSLQDF
ncbi:hypothetical protein [Dyella psychrodurans]|uniref:PH domain-containing protein n=1 Tax=Dyella psychrodurans TaxID=1927960 RepID=A0A370X6V2_9GAMM|nr:hypothetical protein [Dyella psychrodurans]RDS84169.1 hypothetical protein DWU99_10470 [Dyella psychrodurans]